MPFWTKSLGKRYQPLMTFDMQLLLAALGLALIMEGIPYFLWSEKMPEYLRFLSERPPSTLRKMGLAAIIAGLFFLALARKFF
ncbi:hypothetical protein SAMN06295888_102237 [Desulfonatronum zhilinae]|nr:hypothetical protein SAMN06295888_102237 [Desulfonatronum zhilinae]